jgi:hypothetical protein
VKTKFAGTKAEAQTIELAFQLRMHRVFDRAKGDNAAVVKLKAAMMKALDDAFEEAFNAVPNPPEPCPQCGELDCGGAPRFQGTTLKQRMTMRQAEQARKRPTKR